MCDVEVAGVVEDRRRDGQRGDQARAGLGDVPVVVAAQLQLDVVALVEAGAVGDDVGVAPGAAAEIAGGDHAAVRAEGEARRRARSLDRGGGGHGRWGGRRVGRGRSRRRRGGLGWRVAGGRGIWSGLRRGGARHQDGHQGERGRDPRDAPFGGMIRTEVCRAGPSHEGHATPCAGSSAIGRRHRIHAKCLRLRCRRAHSPRRIRRAPATAVSHALRHQHRARSAAAS